jgi:hypothetical protein
MTNLRHMPFSCMAPSGSGNYRLGVPLRIRRTRPAPWETRGCTSVAHLHAYPMGASVRLPQGAAVSSASDVGDRHVRVGFSATDPFSGRFRGPCKSPQLAQILLVDIGLISLHLLDPKPDVVGRQETGDLVMVFVVLVVWRWEEGSKQSAVWASPCQPRGPRLTGSGFTKEVLTISGGLHNAKPHRPRGVEPVWI